MEVQTPPESPSPDVLSFGEDEAASAPVAKPTDPSTHFVFGHRIFQIENCRFALNGSDKLPCFCVPMGEQVAAIELRKLQQEFEIRVGSSDDTLLKQVEKGLRYVREIRPNDSIPREILDGSASWSVEEHHNDMARAKLNMELIFWFTGFRGDMPSLEEMQRTQKDPQEREQMRDAHVKLAQLLDLKDPRLSAQRLQDIAREAAYIEALRERSLKLNDIQQKLNAFTAAFKKDNAFLAEIMRMQDLMRRASRIIADKFLPADGILKEVPRVVGEMKSAIGLVRQVRDDVNIELGKWDDHLALWADMKIERSEANEKYFRKFYQFLAENYMEQAAWGQPKKQ
ncbi:MAG TPA: hypothetical protein VHB73_04475 [Alphaproteobacteria bacterium]|nr:hypothetical protein [Alphaproteobacteria bacterium]